MRPNLLRRPSISARSPLLTSLLVAAALGPLGCEDSDPEGSSSAGGSSSSSNASSAASGGAGGSGGAVGSGGAGGGQGGEGGQGGNGADCPSCPPDPALLAPPLNRGIATSVFDASAFLYSGQTPIQTGVAPGSIQSQRAAVIRGRIQSRSGQPIAGVTVGIHGHAELGSTRTRLDGAFDLVVNGGGLLTLDFSKPGLLPAERQIDVPWNDWVAAPDVVMIPRDAIANAVTLPSLTSVQVARGSVVADADGTRRATLLFLPGTSAVMRLGDGSTQPLDTLTVRATEYTMGPSGPKAMPALLPAASAYTYAIDYSVDEALASGARSVEFSQPVVQYVENFLGFPVGIAAPMGAYDATGCGWVGSADGRVVAIASVIGGIASLDVDGDGAADSGAALEELGITDLERAKLGELYTPGQSLWRVPVPHFSPWDTNWPGRYSNKKPPKKSPDISKPEDDDCGKKKGSIIGVENQSLGERLPIAGAPFALRYDSTRTPGYKAGTSALTIPITDDSPDPELNRVELSITIAGQRHDQTFTPEPNQSFEFIWDGKDAYGRRTQGGQIIHVRVSNIYRGDYRIPSYVTPSFASFGGGATILADSARQEIAISLAWDKEIGSWQAEGESLGGFFVDVHHAYDPNSKTVYLGDGSKRSSTFNGRVVETVAGGGNLYGDGSPATDVSLSGPSDLAVAPDGSVLIAEKYNHRVRKVTPDGTITTVVGSGEYDSTGDGGPATDASIRAPTGLALGPDGSLYIADPDSFSIRQVTPDGQISTLVGPAAFDGSRAPAKLAVAPDGTLFVAEVGTGNAPNSGVKANSASAIPEGGGGGYGTDAPPVILRVRLGACGQASLVPVAGDGTVCSDSMSPCGDGGLGTEAQLSNQSFGLAIAPSGALVFSDKGIRRVRALAGDGLLTTIAGSGQTFGADVESPALDAGFNRPSGVAVSRDGRVYISDPYAGVIRVIDQAGVITTIGGASSFGSSPEDGNGAQSGSLWTESLALHPDGRLLFIESDRVRAIRPPFRGLSDGEIPVPSEDGRELYVFSSKGRHLRTQHALTGAALFTFGYDASGRLITITDAYESVTTIERDASGAPTAIVAPHGQTTQLALTADGYLTALTNPANEAVALGYGPGGLLTSLSDAQNNSSHFVYDSKGRLLTDTDPEGRVKTLTRAGNAAAYSVSFSQAGVPLSSYGVARGDAGADKRTATSAGSAPAEAQTKPDGSVEHVSPDGTTGNVRAGADPRWGMLSALPSESVRTVPGGAQSSASVSQSVSLADPSDPLSLQSLSQTTTVNARSFQVDYDAASRTFTMTTPAGRLVKMGLTETGALASKELPGVLPQTFTYDAEGRLASTQQGTRVHTLAYGTDGLVRAMTDPLLHTNRFGYDAAGRRTLITLADDRAILLGYDPTGKLTSFTPPGRPPHIFAYTKAGQVKSYTPPPPAPGDPDSGFSYAYTPAGKAASITYPSGEQLIYSYDAFNRVSAIATPDGPVTVTYAATTGAPESITTPDSTSLVLSYTGADLTGVLMSGAVSGSIGATYNADGRLESTLSPGAPMISYGYDNDGFMTSAGALSLYRDAAGSLSGASLGGLAEVYSRSAYGEQVTREVTWNGDDVYSSSDDAIDDLGRVSARTETLGGETHTYQYSYDALGRLTTVARDGATVESYAFDPSNGNGANENRTTGKGGVTATYDDQDRLLSYGTKAYTYDANGALKARTDTATGETTAYTYNLFGDLKTAALPDGRQIEYLVDGLNRRVGKKVDGVLTRGWIYAAPLRPAAEMDGAGALVSTFVYATRVNVPEYMIRGDQIYRLITDRVGSVRLVVNVDSGAVAQRLDYDAFGNVLQDTQPGFQPFGFGGGLYDPDTGFVRFGARDYDPETGRFTAKDALLFAGSQANLYVYAQGDPINFTDVTGHISCSNFVNGSLQLIAGVGDIVGGGAAVSTAVAEAATGIGAPVAGLQSAWGLVNIFQGVDELRRSYSYFAGGDDPSPVGEHDNNLSIAETGNSFAGLPLVETHKKGLGLPVSHLDKGTVAATLVSGLVQADWICGKPKTDEPVKETKSSTCP